MDNVIKKQFPNEFPEDVVRIVEAMSFDRGKGVELLGSMAQASQLYTNDFDLYQNVYMSGTDDTVITKLIAEFKAIVRELMKMNSVYIGDIKCGSVDEWEVIPNDARIDNGKVVNYKVLKSKEKLDEMFSKHVITKEEYKASNDLLVTNPTPEQFLEMKNEIKYNIVRWQPKDVLNGYVNVRGRRYTLQEGFTAKAITKLDVVAFVGGTHYADFSMIYDFYNKKQRMNGITTDFENSVQSDILYYTSKESFYKVAKRMYSLARFRNKKGEMDKLLPILNDSQLGLLYLVCGDITTILWILENRNSIDNKKFTFEIDQFKLKLANIYDPEFEKERNDIFGIVNKLVHQTLGKSKTQKVDALQELLEKLLKILNDSSKVALKKAGLLPLKPFFTP